MQSESCTSNHMYLHKLDAILLLATKTSELLIRKVLGCPTILELEQARHNMCRLSRERMSICRVVVNGILTVDKTLSMLSGAC
jgi:hypothetical protein